MGEKRTHPLQTGSLIAELVLCTAILDSVEGQAVAPDLQRTSTEAGWGLGSRPMDKH